MFLDTSVSLDPNIADDANLGKPFDTTGNLKPGFGEGVPLNIRFRDGSIYQSVLTNPQGEFQFTELFPFFNWMIAEVDYARFRATGATIVVDAGGPVPPHDPTHDGKGGWVMPSFNKLNPQTQIAADGAPVGGALYKTETGVVLLEGIQTFLGQTNHIEFGKAPWKGTENGGIAGIVQYAITRAEDDPKNGTAETWEPGIPRVQVNLFVDCDGDGKPDKPVDLSVPGAVAGTCAAGGLSGANGYAYDKPDVDNYPFCWRDPASCGLAQPAMGPEDKKRSRTGGPTDFSYGDVVRWGSNPDNAGAPYIGLGKTDGWDDAIPTGCRPDTYGNGYSVPYGADKGKPLDCYDGLRVWNQIRPAVFDGGYAFGIVAGQSQLPNVKYIVEAVAPPGYFHQSNGDKNVVFGDALAPAPAALPFECVGIDLPVPQFLSLFPGQQQGNPLYTGPGQTAKKCDMKLLDMQPGRNPAPNFFLYTEAPVAGHGVGFILDDMSSEFDVNAPTFGEKHAPPHLPISIRDWTGRELSRVYADEFGSFNFLVPSTFTINPPFPSGVGPNMVVACMNHPGPITNDPVTGAAYAQPQIDPFFSRQYSQFCYTLQYLPGKTTYLDTPVVPVAAYAGSNQNPLDCEFGEGTPQIYSVSNNSLTGPYLTKAGGPLTIISVGSVDVPNPYYDPNLAGSTKTIKRDYGFGALGSGSKVTLNGVALAINTWSTNGITVTVPANAASGQLMVTRTGGATTQVGVTVSVENRVPKLVPAGGSIQKVIDATTTIDGDLILIPPGTYNEFVIVDKKVQLQGWGAPSVTINAAKSSTLALKNWRSLLNKKVDARCGTPTGSTDIANCPAGTPIDPDTGQPTVVAGVNRTFDPLPGQTLGHNTSNNEPLLFGAEEGPGILVVAANPAAGGATNGHVFINARNARIDGITITGADYGGGILASGYTRFLEIANNRVVGNYGTYGGGIRVGHTELVDDTNTLFGGYTDSFDDNVRIRNNWVSQNGSTEFGTGGGIALGNGATNYLVSRNYVCGNYSMGDGGGIGQLGLSNSGKISNNTVIFNQNFNQSANPNGGGIFVGGAPALAVGGLSAGTGNITIDANLIQGNNAGAGEGAGIRLQQVNGLDVPGSAASSWYLVRLLNNIIVDNVAGGAAGGVSLQDALRVRIANNTVANNDSTATAQVAFAGPGNTQSIAQPAGLVSHATSTVLLNAMTAAQRANNQFSDPTSLVNNIIWHNRSFCWAIDYSVLSATNGPTFGLYDIDASGNCNTLSPAGTAPAFRDLAVVGVAGQFTPTYSILSSTVGYGATNISANPQFKAEYVNGNRQQSLLTPEVVSTIATAATTDEGGNFIDIRFGPLTPWNCPTGPCTTLFGDYHLASNASPAYNTGTNTGAPGLDFDGQTRPAFVTADIGADEIPGNADVSITITNNATTVTAGTTTTYVIVVSNAGPDATTARVQNAIPANVSSQTWTCATTSGGGTCSAASDSGAIDRNVTLPSASSVTFTVTASISATATPGSTLSSTAYVSTVDNDPNLANNSATDGPDTILAYIADLAITKTDNRTTVVRGTTGVIYTIVVTNNGPNPVTGATLTDTLPGATRFAVTTGGWTCSASAGSSCTATGTGNASRGGSVSLLNGGTATYTLTGNVPGNAPLGASTNTATITAPAGVTDNPANNTATDVDTILPPLSITKDDGRTTVTRGTTVTYTIVVTNNSANTVAGNLTDTLPGGTQFTVSAWACTASGGSSCTATTSTGNASRGGSVSLLNGGTATYTLTGNVPLAALPGSSSINTATIAVTGFPNVSAADTDTIQ